MSTIEVLVLIAFMGLGSIAVVRSLRDSVASAGGSVQKGIASLSPFEPGSAGTLTGYAAAVQPLGAVAGDESGSEFAHDPDTVQHEELEPNRADTAREGARGRRGSDAADPPKGTPGPNAGSSPIGPGVSGTHVAEPDPPAWIPPDPGSGEAHGSKGAGLNDYAVRAAWEAAANAAAVPWPDASRNMLHYLGNTGQPIEQPVDKVLNDVPEFRRSIEERQQSIGLKAVEEAKRMNATGPVTFPVNTQWIGFGYDKNGKQYDNENWFLALGGWQTNLTGQVTVHPPDQPGGQYRYEISTHVNLRDQYNFDPGKDAKVGPTPIPVPDAVSADLHAKGLAQEFAMFGKSELLEMHGESP